MAEFVITCPGCQKPLQVPPEAVGKPAHCPHCYAGFFLPANADGSPGTPEVRQKLGVPKMLIGPAFAVLILGAAGSLVNGYIFALLTLSPDAAIDFARGRVREVREIGLIQDMKGAAAKKKDGEKAPPPVIDDEEHKKEDEELAASWAPAMRKIHLIFLGVSLVEFVGGLAMVRGRYYPVAIIGCLAAFVNFHHLCCIPGAIVGLWGILILVRDEARKHFTRPS